jgi:hypothetical protein
VSGIVSDIDPQEFGRLQAEVIGLRRDNDRLLELLEKLVIRLEGIEEQLAQAKGGWRTLMWLGGASAGAGGIIAAALTHFFGKGGS